MERFMKSFVKVLLLIAAVTAFGVPPAAADDCGTRRTPIVWRTSTSTDDPRDQGFIDSVGVVRNGSGATLDTSVAFSLYKMRPGGIPNVPARADSVPMFSLSFAPGSETTFTEAGDSIYVRFQVSADGTNWTTTNSADYKVLDPGTSLNFVHNFSTDIVNAAAPDADTWFGWPLGRLIVQGDWSGSFFGWITWTGCGELW